VRGLARSAEAEERVRRAAAGKFKRDFGWMPEYPSYRLGLDQVVAEWRQEAIERRP
jgi:hypothetical protein